MQAAEADMIQGQQQMMSNTRRPNHGGLLASRPCLKPGSEQHALIQQIRRGYNQEPVQGRTVEDDQAMRRLVEMNSRQAQVLSTELYSKPTHFLLELIQNADDCSYAPGVQPEVLLVLMHDALLHATNETGFTAADISSICSMAMSSKSRKVGAFTGEKGIGFKATAVASEVTYISSSGYTFAFDMRPGAYDVPCLGLFCPRWEEGLQGRMVDWLADRLAGTGVGTEVLEGFTTRIWMQLRPDLDSQRLTQELRLLDPYMLLNLRKLKNVTVLMVPQPDSSPDAADRSCQLKQLMRVDVDGARVTIAVEEGPAGELVNPSTHHLLCLRQVLQVPAKMCESEEKRSGVSEVEVVFALPTTAAGDARPDPHAQVFAFLPVKAYGFRFHIQADFILPSSREGILEDRQWNRWLQQELAPAFIKQVMQAVTAHHQHSKSQGPSSGDEDDSPVPTLSPIALLQYLPLPGDVPEDFMAEVSTAILQGLQQQACVLTASGQLSTAQHTVLPDGLLEVDGQQLISNDWLQAGLPGVEYVHAELLAGSDDTAQRTAQVLLQLDGSRFSAALLLSWLNAEGTASHLEGLGPEERAAWLQLLYSCCMKLRAQPEAAPMHLAADSSSSSEALMSAPIVQLHGSHELVSLQQLADSSKQLYLWDDRFGGKAELQLFSTHSSDTSDAASGGCWTTVGSTSDGEAAADSSRQQDRLCFVDPSSLGADGAAMLSTFLNVRHVPLSALVQHVLQQQAEGGLSGARQDQLLLFLLRNAQSMSTQDLQLLQDGLLLRCADTASEADSDTASYAPAKQLYLPLKFSSLQVTQATLSDPALQQDMAAAGVAFVSRHYEGMLQHSEQAGRQGVWQLLKNFGLHQLTLQSAVKQLLKLYGSDKGNSDDPDLFGPLLRVLELSVLKVFGAGYNISLADHDRHLGFLAQCIGDTDCMQYIQRGLLLYELKQDTAAASPLGLPKALFWPMAKTPGAEALTGQLRALCDVELVHPWYVEECDPAIQKMVQDITKTLSLAEVWKRLQEMHSKKCLQQCATTVGITLEDLLLQQVKYLAGVRLELQSHLQQQHTPSYSSSGSAQGFLLLCSTGNLVASDQLYLPPEDAATLELLQELRGTMQGLPLLHPCFEPCWRESDSEQHLLLTKLLGVKQADAAAVIAALVKLHSSCSAVLTESQRGRHLAYLAQHTQLLREQQGLLRQVQGSVLLLDAGGQYRKAGVLHMPLGPHFAELQSDMAAAGMLFLHSSYTADPDAHSSVVSQQAVQHRRALQQLQELLGLLGVQPSDVNSIAKHILKLYSGSTDARPSPEQHLGHLRFIQEGWYELELTVQRQISSGLLLLAAAAPTADTCAAADASSSSKGPDGAGRSMSSSDASSSSSSWVYVHGTYVYTLPSANSTEAGLVGALHLGGARFLHPVYYQRDEAGSDLVLWVQGKLGVRSLDRDVAARFLLDAHDSGRLQSNSCSPHHLAEHALYLAQHAASDVLAKVKHRLLLAVHPRSHDTQQLYRTSSNGPPLYFPAQGERWSLQQVLPADRVMYLHPVYSVLLEELKQDPNRWYERTQLLNFLTYHVGINMRPVAGSAALKKAIQAGKCWQALLLLLHDEWRNYSESDQQVVLKQIKGLWVTTSSGSTALPRCFMLKSNVPSSLISLLQDLKLPILQLPDPDSSGWAFLQAVGVSMELQGSTLLKVLQQLSSSGANPKLDSMQQLYSRIHALGQLDEKTRAAVRSAFEQQQLVYVPGCGKSSKGSWWRSGEVCWKQQVGFKRVYPHIVFVDAHYGSRAHDQQQQHETLESFFVQTLRVRSAGVDDLTDSLLHFADMPAKDAADNVRSVYEHLAAHTADEAHPGLQAWLQSTLSHKPVLLVQHGQALSFAKASSGPIYLPDSVDLQQLFAGDITTLAVQPEKLPALEPLLACIQPALPSLSCSVQRSFADADAGMQKQPVRSWEQLLQQALPFLARYMYCRYNSLYKVLLDGGHLLQLDSTHVFAVRGLVQRLTLGSVSKQIPTAVAAQMLSGEQLQQWLQQSSNSTSHQEGSQADGSSCSSNMHPVLLMDAAPSKQPLLLLHHIAVTYADLLLKMGSSSSTSSSSSKQGADQSSSSSSRQLASALDLSDIAKQLRSFLKDLGNPGGMAYAEAELQLDRIPCLPPEFDPWLAAAESGDSGDGSDDMEDAYEPLVSSELRTAADASSSAAQHTEARGQQAHRPPAATQSNPATKQQSAASGDGGQAAGRGSDAAAAHDQAKKQKPAPAAPVYSFPKVEDAAAAAPEAAAASPRRRRRSTSRERVEREFDTIVARAKAQVESLRLADEFLAGLATPHPASSSQQAAGVVNSQQPNDAAAADEVDAAAGYSLDEVVPEGVEKAWMAGAVSAAQAAADRGLDLQQLWQRQPQQMRPSLGRKLPGSYIVQLPANAAASGAGGGAGEVPDGFTVAGAVSSSGLGLQDSGDVAQQQVSFASGDSDSAGRAGTAASAQAQAHTPTAQPGSASSAAEPERQPAVGTAAAAGAAAAGSSSSTPAGNSWDMLPGAAAAADPYGGHLKVIGDVGERYVYELFSNKLPGFGSECWHSGTRAMIGLPAPTTEPSYDFLYTDVDGQLSGKPGTQCFIECKATTASLSGRSSPKPFEVSSRQWELARALHESPDQGMFMIVRVDRVGSGDGPRIAAVLQDPVQLWKDGQLWVTTPDKLLIEGYPVAGGSS